MKDVGAEIFDVVNQHDQVIGQACRSEVHRLGLRHRSVHVLLFNQAGQLFLQKRSSSKDTWPGFWDSSASGHLDSGETYDACAVREVREELGWELGDGLNRRFKIEACPETGQEFVWVYHSRAEGPFVLHPEEIEDGRWFSMAEVNRMVAGNGLPCALALILIWSRLGRRISLASWP